MKKNFLFTFILLFVNLTFISAVDEKVREYWKKTLEYGVSEQRIGVIKAIENSKSTEDYLLIEKTLLSDVNPNVRGYAAYSLVNLKITNEDLWVNALKNEKDPEVLRKIVYGISELKIKSAGQYLFIELSNRIEEKGQNLLLATIIRAIGEVEYKSAFDFLSGILTNLLYPNEIRSASAIAIGNFADERSIPLLQAILENPGESGELRMYAAYGIGRTGSPKAFDILAPYIEDEKVDLNIRLWGISGLSYVNDKRVVKKLIDFTKVDNMKVRLEAIRSLSRYEKSQEVIEVLKYKALYDPEFSVKKEAKNLLKKLGIDVESSETNQSSSQSSGKK